jgi:hypothetical protein
MPPDVARRYLLRHLRFGWGSLLVFVLLGLALELLHAFKVGWLLDVTNETRRLMLRLAHAHGGLLGLVHIAFAVTVPHLPRKSVRAPRITSICLIAASVLIPGGFFLGGLAADGGDPGLGALVAPLGAALLIAAVAITARATGEALPD